MYRYGALKLSRRFDAAPLAGKIGEAGELDRARRIRRIWFETLTLIVACATPCARDILDPPQGFQSSHRLNSSVEHLPRLAIGFFAHASGLFLAARGRRNK